MRALPTRGARTYTKTYMWRSAAAQNKNDPREAKRVGAAPSPGAAMSQPSFAAYPQSWMQWPAGAAHWITITGAAGGGAQELASVTPHNMQDERQGLLSQAAAEEKGTKGDAAGFSCGDFFTNLSGRRIRNLNRIAFAIHFVLFIVAIIGRYRPGNDNPPLFSLKYDRIHLTARPRASSSSNGTANATAAAPFVTYPFVQLVSPYTGGAWSTFNATVGSASRRSVSETCGAAPPNTLDFAGSANVAFDMWTYAKGFGTVDVGWCVVMVFFMSFAFQSSLELLGWSKVVPSFNYDQMFEPKRRDDGEDSEALSSAFKDPQGTDLHDVLTYMLHFNWWRFVEYFGSGSLVMITVALFAGIVDVELLICMFTLSATCMALGAVAEFGLRSREVLVAIMERVKNSKTDSVLKGLEPVMQNIIDKLWWCFWLSHVLGWLDILVPWIIIMVHYMAWWGRCDAETLNVPRAWLTNTTSFGASGESTSRSSPPDFVMVGKNVQQHVCMHFAVPDRAAYASTGHSLDRVLALHGIWGRPAHAGLLPLGQQEGRGLVHRPQHGGKVHPGRLSICKHDIRLTRLIYKHLINDSSILPDVTHTRPKKLLPHVPCRAVSDAKYCDPPFLAPAAAAAHPHKLEFRYVVLECHRCLAAP